MKPSPVRRVIGLILLLVSVGLLSCQTMFVSLTPASHHNPPPVSRQ